MNTKPKYDYNPDYAIPPGETLHEVMESLGMSAKELSIRTGLTQQTISRIFKGDQPISYETANLLEMAVGVPARLWNNLESQYRERLLRLEEKTLKKHEIEWLDKIPVKELQTRGHIGRHKELYKIFRDALSFYRVASVETWEKTWEYKRVAARRSPNFNTDFGAATAWIQQGELKAQQIECKPYNKSAFRSCLDQILPLTRLSPHAFVPEMQSICAETGVAVVFVQGMNKAPWNGAMRWLSPHKAMVLLSIRGKGEDIFWFSFFHEAGHVLHDGKKETYINLDNSDNETERKADQFAADTLIPSSYDHEVQSFTKPKEFLSLAEKLNIGPGIVVGRFHHLTKNWKAFNSLVNRFSWEDFQS